MTASALSIPSAALARGLASGTHIPGAALVRDAVAGVPEWLEASRRELADEADPVVASDLAVLVAHLGVAGRGPTTVASRGGE